MLFRRSFLRQASLAIAATRVNLLAADHGEAIAETSTGKVRGIVSGDIKVFRGIPYGGTTAGKNRFMPPTKPAPWAGTRDAIAYGQSAPQVLANGTAIGNEDCLVLNVCTPSLGMASKRPVMVWLHGGGFATGAGHGAADGGVGRDITDGINLARSGDVVAVSINHRLNVMGFTYFGDQAGADFALSGGVGVLDIVAALQWVRDNISQFGGDPNSVTIFGQSGGGRKVATLMSMPSAQGLYHRAIIESGALLRLTNPGDGLRATRLLMEELAFKPNQFRELQNVPVSKLLAANAQVLKKLTPREPGYVPNSPAVDGKTIPTHPWDPAAPAMSAKIPLLIGWARTEETLYDRPTAETLALDEAGLKKRAATRLGMDPDRVIEAYRKAHPKASAWDLWILIATDHPRGMYARELASRKAAQQAAPAFLYRFDWETAEQGGHMRSPHGVEVPFVFHNVGHSANRMVSKTPEAHALEEKVSAAWVAFARSGNPNTPKLPQWPAFSAAQRDTMLFNNECKVEKDPDRGPRVLMEKMLKL